MRHRYELVNEATQRKNKLTSICDELFPELTQMIQDNLFLCKLIVERGRRDGFNREGLDGKGMSEKKVEAILTASDKSKPLGKGIRQSQIDG